MSAAAFFSLHLLALFVLTATVYVAGRLIARSLDGGDRDGPWERFGVAVALGLALAGSLGLVLGLAGVLRTGPLMVAFAGVHVAGRDIWRELARGARAGLAGAGRGRRLAAALGLLGALAPLAVLGLYPPTAFDETLYHLPFARAFASSGGVPFLPALRVPIFPQLSELIFAEVLLLADDVAVHGVELLATLAAAALLVAWGRRAAGSPSGRWIGWLAAGIWLGNPIAVHLSGTAYVEPGLALFGTAALYAQERWRETEVRGWLALAAAFAGSAAATKYLGLVFVGLVFLLTALAARRGRRFRDLALVALVAAAVAGPWYVRILYYTGNPVFPFFAGLFGTPTPWDAAWPQEHRGFLSRLGAFARIPWSVVFNRQDVGYQPPHSPLYLLGLPLLAAGAWHAPRVRRLLGAVFVYALLFLVLAPDARYLVAVLPALSLALALSLGSLPARWRRPHLIAALALAAFLSGWFYAVYRVAEQGAIPVTAVVRDRYLGDHFPVWPAVRFLNRTRGMHYTVYALHAENMVYLADGTLLGDWNGPARFAVVEPLLADPPALHSKLRALGADHLLTIGCCGDVFPTGDPVFQSLFQQIYMDGTSTVYALR